MMLECPDVFDAHGATILKLSLGAALRKDVVLVGAVQDVSNAESRGPSFRANEHRTQHRCDGPEHLPGAVVLDCVEIDQCVGAPDNSSLSHFSAMTWPAWLGRAVRNRHRHAIEQASHRWRGGRPTRRFSTNAP